MDPLVAVITDTHAGGMTALAVEEFETSDKQIIRWSPGQKWLGESWEEYLGKLKRRAKGRKVIGVHLGDAIEGNHHRTVQALPVLFDQEAMDLADLGPFRSLCDRFYMVRGTEAHDGEGAQSISRLARDLNADAVDWEFRLRIGGVLSLFVHHGRAGGRPWTTGAANVAAEIMLQCSERGEEIPRLVFTGHRHRIDDSGEKFSNIRVLSCPAWQLSTSFGWKVGAFSLSHIGGVFVEGENVTVERYTAPRRPIHKID